MAQSSVRSSGWESRRAAGSTELACEGVAARGVVVLADELDGRRHTEIRRGIARALQLGPREERVRLLCVAPRHDRPVDALLPLRPRPEECRSFRRAQPLVTVPRI